MKKRAKSDVQQMMIARDVNLVVVEIVLRIAMILPSVPRSVQLFHPKKHLDAKFQVLNLAGCTKFDLHSPSGLIMKHGGFYDSKRFFGGIVIRKDQIYPSHRAIWWCSQSLLPTSGFERLDNKGKGQG